MKFSKKTEYAIRALLEMALRSNGGVLWMQISQIAQTTNIPEKFLEQILLNLRNGGLLKSRRGVDGGYSLNIPAAQIKVDQIVRLLEGHNRSEVAPPPVQTDDDAFAVYCDLVQQAEKASHEVLNGCSLADLAQSVKTRHDSRMRNSEYQI